MNVQDVLGKYRAEQQRIDRLARELKDMGGERSADRLLAQSRGIAKAAYILEDAALRTDAMSDGCDEHNFCEHSLALTVTFESEGMVEQIGENWTNESQRAVAEKAAAMALAMLSNSLFAKLGSQTRIAVATIQEGGD